MKTVSRTAMALALALLLVAPAMAFDTAFTSEYHSKPLLDEHSDMADVGVGTAYLDSPLRVRAVLKVSDPQKLSTHFAARQDNAWRLADYPNNAQLDGAYLNIETPFGTFDIGRMTGTFGTTFADGGLPENRIRYTLPLGDFTLVAIYGRKANTDHENADRPDGDSNGYSLAGVYRMPVGVAGLLLHLEDSEMMGNTGKKEFSLNPYVDVIVSDMLKVQGELKYQFGGHRNGDIAPVGDDPSRFAYNLEATAMLGAFSFTGGYAFVSGDAGSEQTWSEGDWDRMWILTGGGEHSYEPMVPRMGYGGDSVDPKGGLTATGDIPDPKGDDTYSTSRYGAKVAYLDMIVSPMAGLDVGLLFAASKAANAPVGWSDEQGYEWDFHLTYKLFDNLSYKFIAAFLSAGDFWKAGDPDAGAEGTYSLFNQLKLKF